MGLILDSSVLITAERNGETVAQLLKQVLASAATRTLLSPSIALVELAHGIHRAKTPEIRERR